MNMAAAGFGGQTLNDRLNAAKYALAGQGLAQKVCKATTEELMGPKKKHLDCKYQHFVTHFTPITASVTQFSFVTELQMKNVIIINTLINYVTFNDLHLLTTLRLPFHRSSSMYP